MLSTIAVAAAAEGQGLADIPAGIAALIGALIGGAVGVIGQIATERMRQKGERRHQNRLLRQETYAAAVRQMNVLGVMGRQMSSEGPLELDEYPEFDTVIPELSNTHAAVRVLGSASVVTGIGEVMGWYLAIHHGDEQPRREAAASYMKQWIDWTFEAMRRDLEVEPDIPLVTEPPRSERSVRSS
ncbi:hypothetical protein [Georgenia faecalis]|uniref:DUF4760 domain-containing protein n=1 Tax=Georgenia faecalis TaxID=2483799 RepID=A0ABV9D6Y1_9MICO|nr:hypothetical protein [Georgenia faecalis]